MCIRFKKNLSLSFVKKVVFTVVAWAPFPSIIGTIVFTRGYPKTAFLIVAVGWILPAIWLYKFFIRRWNHWISKNKKHSQ